MRTILIHSDNERLETLAFAIESYFEGAEVIRSQSQQAALNELLDDKPVDLIVANNDDSHVKLFKYLSSMGSDIPCILVFEQNKEEVHAFPDIDFIDQVEMGKDGFPLIKAIQSGLKAGKIGQTASEESPDYVKIKTELLIKSVPLQADVFIRLSKIKYVKLFKKGDVFTEKDLEKYLEQKNVEFLYVHRDDSGMLLGRLTDSLKETLAKATPDTDTTKVSVQVQDAVVELSRTLGFTEEIKTLVKENVRSVIHNIRANKDLRDFLIKMEKNRSKYYSSHSVMAAQIACSIATYMAWHSDVTFEKLTYAALLHDITLKNRDVAPIRTLDELSEQLPHLPEEEAKKFANHPHESAELALTFTEIPADVGIIIREHHERPDGSGFPRGLAASRISPLSCVFIIAHDIVHAHFFLDQTIGEFIKANKQKYMAGNFRKIIQAMEAAQDSSA